MYKESPCSDSGHSRASSKCRVASTSSSQRSATFSPKGTEAPSFLTSATGNKHPRHRSGESGRLLMRGLAL